MPMVVAPNPAVNEVTFRNIAAGDEVSLQDLTGREVANGKAVTTALQLTVSGLPAGMYVARQMRRGAVVGTVQVSVVK
jgi:hypothetical protein